MSKLKTILVLMLSVAIVGIGCAGGPLKEANIGEADTEEYQIQQVLDTFVEAYQNHNLELLKSTLWEESSYYGTIVANAKSENKIEPSPLFYWPMFGRNLQRTGRRAEK